MADTMKHCYGCGYQPRSEFNKRKRSKDGLDDLCRACKTAEHRRYYQKNSGRIKQKSLEWYANNKEKRSATAAEYYQRTQALKPTYPCACGCGGMASSGRKYLNGHYNKAREYNESFRLKMSQVKSNPSPETRRNLSEGNKKRPDRDKQIARFVKMVRQQRGEKHPNWKGGIANAPYGNGFTRALRKEVKIRDGWQCQNPGCLRKNKKMNCHHIDYDKMNNTSDNLITLCVPCHAATNAHRDYWRAFYAGINRKHSVCRLVAVGGR